MDQSPRSFDKKRRKPSWALKKTQEPATLFRGLINFMSLKLSSMTLDGPWLDGPWLASACSPPELTQTPIVYAICHQPAD
jgi:hypothetical protein